MLNVSLQSNISKFYHPLTKVCLLFILWSLGHRRYGNFFLITHVDLIRPASDRWSVISLSFISPQMKVTVTQPAYNSWEEFLGKVFKEKLHSENFYYKLFFMMLSVVLSLDNGWLYSSVPTDGLALLCVIHQRCILHIIHKPIIHFNPLCPKFFIGNIKLCLQFMSFLLTDMTQVVEILPHLRQEFSYYT